MRLSKEIKDSLQTVFSKFKDFWKGNLESIENVTRELEYELGSYTTLFIVDNVLWLCVKANKDFNTAIAMLYLLGYEVE